MGQVSDSFYHKLCDRLAIPDKHSDVAIAFFKDWQRAEGGDSAHNPFNTTFGEPGATDYNSVHVRNYPNEDEGVDATARTLTQGRASYGYDAIIYALRDGNAQAAARAVDHSSWGTHGLEAVVAGDHAQPSGPPRTHTGGHADVAAFQQLCAELGHVPANSRTSSGGFDGISGPGTLGAAEAVLREGHAAVARVQEFLTEHGHAPQNSRTSAGAYDGIVGPGTQAALHDFLGR